MTTNGRGHTAIATRPGMAQLSFSWLPDKPMLKVSEIVAATGMQTTYVEEWAAQKCHRYPRVSARARTTAERETGDGRQETEAERKAREAIRVPRDMVVELLVQSARYSLEDKVDAVSASFRALALPALLELRSRLEMEIRRKA